MKTYIAIHDHRFGASVYPFRSDQVSFDSEEIARALGIDYEPEYQEESIEVAEVNLDSIPTI